MAQVTTVANPLAGPSAPGMVAPGNIDLHSRPVVRNADGSISTVRSMSFNEDGREVLVPTVAADGSRILNEREAIDQYHRTGQHLGMFATPAAATAYAQSLHEQQAAEYLPAAARPAADSLAPAYQAHVQNRQVADAASEELAAVMARRAAKAGQNAPPAAPGALPAGPASAPARTAPTAPQGASSATNASPASASSAGTQAAAAPAEPGWLSRTGNLALEAAKAVPAVAGDIAEGATAGVLPGVLGGVRDATQHTLELIKSTGDWLDANVAHIPAPPGLKQLGEAIPAQLPGQGTLTGTGTEQAIRTATDYLAGFALGGKVLDAVKGGELLAPAAANVAKGVVADFAAMDPKGERLGNLWNTLGLPKNALADWMAAKPGDSEAEGRFKNALEGAGLGLLTQGVISAASAWKAARDAAAGGKTAEAAAATVDVTPKVSLDDLKAKLGDPAAALVERKPAGALDEPAPAPEGGKPVPDGTTIPPAQDVGAGVVPRRPGQPLALQAQQKADRATAATSDLGVPTDVAAKGVAYAEHTPSFAINWSKVDAPEDVQRAMSQMADSFAGDLDAARRGEVSFEQQKLGAQAENAWNVLVTRRQGQPLNAEQSLAARELWASSGAKLSELAQAAADNPSEGNLFAFQKQLATHYMVQREVIAARTETARALGSWRIPVGGDAERARQIDWLLANAGGTDTTRALAQRMAILARQGNVQGLDMMADKAGQLTTVDAIRSAWINALLSNPPTHLANMGANLVGAAQQVWERYGAEKISQALGQDDGVAAGESLAQVYGLVTGWKDALRYAAKASMTGESGFGIGKVEEARPFALGQRAEVGGDYANGELGRAVDYLGQIMRSPRKAVGEVANSPGTALVAEDEWFKTVGYRMELHAQSLRQATAEARQGLIANEPEAIGRRMAQLVNDPPENIRLASIDQALYQTFNNAPGELGKAITKLRDSLNVKGIPVGGILLPFAKVPANVLKYTLQRTPLGYLMADFKADMQAGGARQALALSRMAAGSATMMVASDLAMGGMITGSGPKDPVSKAALPPNWQPYSVKGSDGRYFSYNRMDPVGNLLGIAADMVDVLHNTDLNRRGTADTQTIATALPLMIANDFLSKTYVQGISQLVDALSDPQRAGPRFFEGLAGSIVPGIVAGTARTLDPHAKDVRGMMDAIMARTPGLSDKVPNRLDLWGRPVMYQSGIGGVYDFLSPVRATSAKSPEPVDSEIARLRLAPTMPQRVVNIGGNPVDLDKYPGAYERYQALAGNDAKKPEWGGMGAKDYLNAVITGRSPMSQLYRMFTDGPDGGKSGMIRDTISKAREQALKVLVQERPDLRVAVSRLTKAPQVQGVPAMPAMPTLGVGPTAGPPGVQGPSTVAPRGLPNLGAAVQGLRHQGGVTTATMGGTR